MGGLSSGLYFDYAKEVAKRALAEDNASLNDTLMKFALGNATAHKDETWPVE